MDLKAQDFLELLVARQTPQDAAQQKKHELATGDKPACDVLEQKKWLFEKRLGYARYFFDHHAKQRMSMFNFFLLFVGFIVAGYANLFKDGSHAIASSLAVAGMALTVVFIFLERRNEELVHLSEDVLRSLESDVLFVDYNREVKLPRRRGWFLMKQGRCRQWPLGIFRRQEHDQQPKKDGGLGHSLYEHGNWLPFFQYLIAIFFLFLALLPCLLPLFQSRTFFNPVVGTFQ
jgi:hypothetical protein